MTLKVILAATPEDVQLCNDLEPPLRGVDVGGGIHVVIPVDWLDRIAAGQDVPGCTYARIRDDGSLLVSDLVQAQLALPAAVKDLPAASVSRLGAELSAAPDEATVIADQPIGVGVGQAQAKGGP